MTQATRLALGTAQFGLQYGIANSTGQVNAAEVKRLLALAQLSGIDTLDTAFAYGESEQCIGSANIPHFKVITKLPELTAVAEQLTHDVEKKLYTSLQRLCVSNVYGLLLHRPDQLLEPNGKQLYTALKSLKERGLVEKIGISVYSPMQLETLMSKYDFDIVQLPFNLIDKRFYESGAIRRLKNEGVEVHTRSVFLQGLLLLRQPKIPVKFLQWSALWERWHHWLNHHRITALQACLSFPLSCPDIDKIIVGVDSLTHLKQIIDMSDGPKLSEFPDIGCGDERLINPACWGDL